MFSESTFTQYLLRGSGYKVAIYNGGYYVFIRRSLFHKTNQKATTSIRIFKELLQYHFLPFNGPNNPTNTMLSKCLTKHAQNFLSMVIQKANYVSWKAEKWKKMKFSVQGTSISKICALHQFKEKYNISKNWGLIKFRKEVFVALYFWLISRPKLKKIDSWGCFGILRISSCWWAQRFSKLMQKWLRKLKLKLATME